MIKTTLPCTFFSRDTHEVARDLLGKQLVRQFATHSISGIIVETEAYTSDDPACHAYRGMTPRTAPLFGPVGHTYIYLSYGMHWCLNIVARNTSTAAGGVLIRALEPVEGIEWMKINRRCSEQQLTNGPGKLTQALSITRELVGVDVTNIGRLYILDQPAIADEQIMIGPRIGISQAVETPWRFYCKNNRWVSR